jgi:hypothetical protein
VKRKTDPGSFEDEILAALEADLIRFELRALEAISKTAFKVHYIKGPHGQRPVYRPERLNAAVTALINDQAAPDEARRAAKILSYLPSLWEELESNKPSWRFAQVVSAFASAIQTPKAAHATGEIYAAPWKEKLEARKQAPKKIQKRGVAANAERADRFYVAVKDFAWKRKQEEPLLRATHIADEIKRLANPLDPAKRDPRFPTMSDGKPYSYRHILDTTRDALRALAP